MEEVNVRDLFEYFLKKIWLVFVIVGFFVVLGGVYSVSLKTPLYKATTTVVLSTDDSNTSTITQNEITVNKNLVSTYEEIVKSRTVLNQVISDLGLNCTYQDLVKEIEVKAVGDTQIISISVSNTNADNAAKIADYVANIFKKKAEEIYNLKNVSILDSATTPSLPYNKNYLKDGLIYLGLGLILSLIYIFAAYYMDRNLHSGEEAEKISKLPVMGTIRDEATEIKSKKLKNELVVDGIPKSNFAEDIRTVRTNIEFASIDTKIKTILITSSIPGEGKSFISTNLAIAIAQNNKKVLIIDADLRKGRLHNIFNIKNNEGLSNMISKQEPNNVSEYIKKTSIKNLFFISRGVIPPNPSELLSSKSFKDLLESVESIFDYVIIDGTPISNLPDSLILSKVVDTTLLVSTIGYTPIDAIHASTKALENVNAKVGGIIVNRVPTKKNKYYYSDYKYE
jgi:polysaccharide biosynthesis transport protein